VDSPFKHPFAFTSRNADNICSVNYTHLHAQTVPIPGPATPVHKLVFDHVPGIHYFRFPTRLLLVTDVSLVALARSD